jgi:hypothetical protein
MFENRKLSALTDLMLSIPVDTLRRESPTAPLLGLRVRIPPAKYFSLLRMLFVVR